MAEENDKKQPWEVLGFASFEACEADRLKKIEDAESEAKAQKAKVALQDEEIAKLRKAAGDATKEDDAKRQAEADAAKAKKEAEEAEKNKVDPFKEKAASLYASLTKEEQAKAEQAIQKMPENVRELAGSGFEGKYALLKQLFPKKVAKVKDGAATGFFGDLAPEEKELSISEQIANALSGKKKVATTPASSGSGFVQGRYDNDDDFDNQRGRSAENPDIISNGIYGINNK